jgi:hypothetical protein
MSVLPDMDTFEVKLNNIKYWIASIWSSSSVGKDKNFEILPSPISKYEVCTPVIYSLPKTQNVVCRITPTYFFTPMSPLNFFSQLATVACTYVHFCLRCPGLHTLVLLYLCICSHNAILWSCFPMLYK